MEAELFKQNPWWEGKFEEKSFLREIYLDKINENLKSKEIIFLTGIRRIGKTTIMKQEIDFLLKKTKPESILFVNLDSFNLKDYSIHQIIEKYREIHKKSVSDFFYFFIDEITSKENFEMELKSIYDNENIKVICSSSTASLMNDKKAMLTGRTKTIEVMPLTFLEFLKFKNADVKKSDRAKLESYFKDYLRIGGIPYYVLTEDREYMQELVDSIIYKDIVARYNIINEKIIRELFILLCERVGKIVSYNKLSNMLGISVDSTKRYINYFEKAYLFYTVSRFSGSLNEGLTSPKKIYAGDVGIKNLITNEKDFGASYENLVFLKIKSEKPNYYLKNKIEIDFITKDSLIEAKYNSQMNEKQKKIFDEIKRKNKITAQGIDFFIK